MDRILEFADANRLLVFGLVTSFLLVVFSEIRRKATNMMSVDSAVAVKLINNEATVIDLRSVESFARGHIVNAKNVPLDELSAKVEKLEVKKDKPVLAVCDMGVSSTKAVATLQQAGFENVYSLKGGMNGWSQAGLPVVTGKKTKPKKR
ncbi:MAG: rhodanese-like domain-containing protein [Woeseiaceae bacterium]|nr:rhodanese-like domain-containing protein [Woeseiaceae bacterium]